MDTLHFEQVIVTPSGTPLNGRVGVDVHDNGDYHVRFEMHSSSILAPFDFNVRAYLTAPGFPTLAFVRIGHVDALEPAAVAAYKTYVATPGADLARTGRDLSQLAAQLRAIGDTADSATAQQAADDLAAPH